MPRDRLVCTSARRGAGRPHTPRMFNHDPPPRLRDPPYCPRVRGRPSLRSAACFHRRGRTRPHNRADRLDGHTTTGRTRKFKPCQVPASQGRQSGGGPRRFQPDRNASAEPESIPACAEGRAMTEAWKLSRQQRGAFLGRVSQKNAANLPSTCEHGHPCCSDRDMGACSAEVRQIILDEQRAAAHVRAVSSLSRARAVLPKKLIHTIETQIKKSLRGNRTLSDVLSDPKNSKA